LWAALLLFALFFIPANIDEGISRWQLTHGQGTDGRFLLTQRVKYTEFRAPPHYNWAGTFISDDGSVVESVALRGRLPGDNKRYRVPNGGWEAGDSVRVRWIDDLPDEVYLPSDDPFRWWVEGNVVVIVGLSAIGVIAVIVRWRRRRIPPEEDNAPVRHELPPAPPVSESQQLADRRAQLSKDLESLKAELQTIKARSHNDSAS